MALKPEDKPRDGLPFKDNDLEIIMLQAKKFFTLPASTLPTCRKF